MATPVAEIEFIPDEQVDFIPDDAPAADAIDFVPDEVVAEEAQRATAGAVQALDVMAAPRAFDWSEVNEKMDAERFREAEGLRAQGQPEQAAALLNEITPFTTAGQYVAQQRAGEAQAAAEVEATKARGGATPSEALRRGLGPGLSATVQPVVESGLRNVGAAAGGALAAAKLSPTPIGMASRLSTALGIALPIGGSVMGAIAGGSAQEALMQIGETPEETQRRQQLAAEAAARDPGLTKLGGAVATLPFFGPSLAQFGRAAAGDVGAATNIALSGTIGAGVEVGGALLRGDTMSARDIAEAFALNAFLNEPTKLGRKLGLKPSSEQQAVEDATAAEIAATREVPSIPLGPTSEVGAIAGMRQAPSAIPRRVASGERIVTTPLETFSRPYPDSLPLPPDTQTAPETPATRTDEQRIAELVAAGMTPEEAAEIAATREVPSIPIGPTSEVGVVAGMRQAPSAIPRRAEISSEFGFNKQGDFWVAREGDAFARATFGPTEVKVHDLAVLPESQRKGEGGAMVEKIKTAAGDRLVTVVPVAKDPVKQADLIRFYERHGFTRDGNEMVWKKETPATRTDEQRVAELVAAGMTPEEAAAGIARAKAAEVPPVETAPSEKYFKGVENAPVNEGIEAAEENYYGGISDFGDPTAARDIQLMPGYFDYRSHLEDAARATLGDTFTVWRAMSREQLDAWRNGDDIGPISVTFSKNLAENWSNFAGQKGGDVVVVSFDAPAESIVMRGRPEESELVIDANQIQAPNEQVAASQPNADPSVPTGKTPPEPPTIPPARPTAPEAPQPIGPEPTSNKESVVNAERAQRALDPVIKEAAIENPAVVGYAEDVIATDPQRPQRIIDRLRAAPPEERTISLVDGGILLIERTKLRARRDAALARASRKEGSAMEQAIAQAEFDAAEGQLNAMDQAAQDARSTWGRFGQFWQRSMREDFSLANLERRARLSKDGPLTEKDIKGLTAIAEKAKAAHEAFDIRQKQLELESRQSAIEAKIAEVSGKDIPAPIMQRFRDYMQRLSVAADFQAKKAEEALRAAFEKSQRLGAVPNAPDPILGHVIDLAFAKVVKGAADFGGWSAEMVSKWGSRIEPYLENAWAAATAKAESSVDRFTGDKKKRAAIKAAAKVPLNAAAQQARIEQAIGARIAEGKPLSSLAPYVNKLQESFIAQGIAQREPLIDAVHGALQKHDPAITRDDAMEIMSKYGSDYATPLSKDPVKQTRRQVDGEIQQLLKLRDIAAKVPLPKSGPERPTPGPTWRNLIKQVNAAKKKLGVVVTDPETQLKSSQDAIRTRLRNDIEDMTLELETGERPPEKTPAEYTQDMEILKGVRDRVRETLRSIDENPQLTDEQRLALTKRSAEESLALWERRLAGETAKAPKQRITSPEIEAIRAKRDAIKAEVEELNAADAVLQENRKAEALVRQIEATEAQLASNAVRVKAQGADSQLVAEAREQLAAVRAALDTKRANDPLRQAEAIEKAEQALEASIKKLDADLQAGNIATRTKPTRLESDRLIYLRAQRNALNQLRAQLRAEARPRIAADQLAIKMRTTQMLKRAAELRRRIAAGDFGPRTRKAPVDISGDRAALDAQADLMSVDAEFQKLQEQWKLDQLTWPQQVLRRAGQAWDASANIFLSFDLSTPLQTAFAMAAHPVTGAKAVGKGAKAFYEQFIKSSDAYANREAARIANSTNAKNGLYKAMKLELPSALGKKREENMVNVLEQLADLDAKWAGLPDVVKGLFKLEGKTLLRGGKRLASVIPKVAGSGIKASNSAFETIANTMRARTADAMLARWYGRGRGTPTKQQLELLGEQVNIATGKGGLRSGDSVRRLLFAPNYYLSIIKQLSGYQLGKAAVRLEGQVAKDIATEYVRAVATMGALYGLNMLFGNEVEWDARSKEFGRPKTDRGTAIDLTMGRGAWITAGAQIATGERIQNGKIKDADRKGTALAFAGGRLSRGVATALTSAFGEDYRGKPIEGSDIAKDFLIPLGWRNFDDVLRKEGFTRGSFIQLLNILGVTHNVHE